MPAPEPADILRFHDFLLDCRGLALYYGGKYVKLRGKPIHALIHLANNAGQLVAASDLTTAIWKENSPSDPKNGLERIISRIRHALGDTSEPHQIIGTMYGEGYLFIPRVLPALRSELPPPRPPGSRFMDDLAKSFVVQQATVPDIKWAAELAGRVYSGIDIIPETLMLEWYRQNSDGFSVVRSKMGELVGNLDLLPLKPAALEDFIAGRLIEKEFVANHLYPPSQFEAIFQLYVESFVTIQSGSLRANPMAAAQLLSEFHSILERICNPAKLHSVYAIAASEAGKRLLNHLGFGKCGENAKRRDKHDLFSVGGSRLIEALQEFFGDGRCDEQTLRLFEDADSEERGL